MKGCITGKDVKVSGWGGLPDHKDLYQPVEQYQAGAKDEPEFDAPFTIPGHAMKVA
jgi:hypothetical protein